MSKLGNIHKKFFKHKTVLTRQILPVNEVNRDLHVPNQLQLPANCLGTERIEFDHGLFNIIAQNFRECRDNGAKCLFLRIKRIQINNCQLVRLKLG